LQRLLAGGLDDPFVVIQAYFVAGLHAFATGHAAQAATIFRERAEQARGLGLFAWDLPLQAWSGFSRLVLGDLEGAGQARDALKNHPGSHGAYGAHYYHQLSAAVALEQGDLAQATHFALEMAAAAERAGSPFMDAWAQTTLAAVEVTKDGHRAPEYLDAALDACGRLHASWAEAGVLISRALYACRFDGADQARRALQAAMTLMREQTLLHMGYAPEHLRLFAAKALEFGVDADYARKILEANSGTGRRAPPAHLEAWPWALKIYTLGPFRLVKHGVPVTFGRKPPRRPLEILKALIAMGGRDVPETRILDALWPDDEADAARNAFSTALSRLRRIAGRDLVRLEGGKLSLDTTRCWVDARAFETLLERATEPNALRQAVELYQDKFLAEDAEAPWSMPMRERLQSRYAEALAQLAVAHQKAGDHEGAAALFKRGLAMDELREDYYQGLMRSYLALNRPEEARQAFEFCKRRLGIHRNRKPSAATVAPYESIDGTRS
jgi:DNA-binding SARP family transcriptional activator